jgi:hypothetical protein
LLGARSHSRRRHGATWGAHGHKHSGIDQQMHSQNLITAISDKSIT